MTDPAPDPRTDPPLVGSEREILSSFLDWHRDTLTMKCAGVSDEQMRKKAVATSGLSLLGLVRHMAEVERSWFRRTIAGEDIGLVYSDDWDYQAAYQPIGSVEDAFATWRAEIEHSRRILDSTDLEVTAYRKNWDESVSLRWVLVHMVEEYARHNGHADLIREAIDGRTGE